MSASALRPRKLFAVLGALIMLAGFGVTVGKIQPTEASWAEQVHGKSEISAGQPYARAISSYGTMFPVVSSRTDLGPNEILAGAAKPGTNYDQRLGGLDYAGIAGFIPLQASNRSCARAGVSASECGAPAPQASNATSYAVAETGQLKMWAGAAGANRLITIGHTLNLSTARTTAECRPGAEGIPGLDRNATVILGGEFSGNLLNVYAGGGTVISMPQLNGTTSGVWNDGLYRYEGTLSHTSTKGESKASSQLRLHVRASLRTWPYSQRWTLDLILAHAECGTALSVPPRPDRPARESAWPAQMTMARMASPVLEQEPAPVTSETGATTAPTIAELPSTSAPTNETTAPVASEPAPASAGTSTSTTTNVSTAPTSAPTPEESSAPGIAPTEDATAEPTEQTAVPEGPQQPESVRAGREFTVVNRDGVELGTAKVEDIVRTPGCGVELTLSITTSAEAGPDRWASVGPDDFAEVRASGATRGATRLSSDCEQAAKSRTTALSSGRGYEIVIAFQIDDSAQQAMLRPDGTAGWIFDLPPLTTVTVTTSPSAAPTTAGSPAKIGRAHV